MPNHSTAAVSYSPTRLLASRLEASSIKLIFSLGTPSQMTCALHRSRCVKALLELLRCKLPNQTTKTLSSWIPSEERQMIAKSSIRFLVSRRSKLHPTDAALESTTSGKRPMVRNMNSEPSQRKRKVSDRGSSLQNSH